ncbi:FkbM family methyltransferase [Candidatus Electrothrix sp.]|uniref:FkbM family methyltransferase n=1 Tax=Candidatus Electrothrix sp. TaxID=2170559 RepID=UPI004056FFF3
MNFLLNKFRILLAKANIAVTKQETFDRLIYSEQQLLRYQAFLSFTEHLEDNYLKQALALLPQSKAEIFQDIFVALVLKEKEKGFFVEFGATDGISGNNTWIFEKKLLWDGLLAEPARVWHERLAQNRTCTIVHDCVWRESGQTLDFWEAIDAGFSTLGDYAERDRHAQRRKGAKSYVVQTISLHDLLKRANAPKKIDYLSIDTEGSEYDILSKFPFEEWEISIMTIEHNFRPERDAMHSLLRSKGFVRVVTNISQFDDWYVIEHLANNVFKTFKQSNTKVSA